MMFAIARSRIVRGMDRFANLAKLSLFLSLLRMFNATRLEAVPIGVAIPPTPVPTASAHASGARAMPELAAIEAMIGMKTVTSGTLSTIWEMSAVVHNTRVTD